MTRFLLAACLVLAIASPASAQTRWLKGNLHTHSFWSDGNDFPEMIAARYRDRGYDFLALSDHNILSEGEKWFSVARMKRRNAPNALEKYRARFGDDWVETRGEGDDLEVRLKTLDEVRSKLQRAGEFILIQSEEISDAFSGVPIHLNATNIQALIPPQGGDSVRDVIRRDLVAIDEQAERTGQPVLGHVNHPNYHYALTAEDMAYVLEEHFFEVYNGHPDVHSFGDAEHISVERMWDIANTIRIAELDAPPLFALAVDDAHNYHDGTGPLPFRGWVMVRAAKLDAPSIIAAMRRGDFYASSGVTLRDVTYDTASKTLTVEVEPAPDPDAKYTIRFIGTRRASEPGAAPEVGEVFAEITGTRAGYQLRGDELYVRATITSSLPVEFPIAPNQPRQAWIQPVGWE